MAVYASADWQNLCRYAELLTAVQNMAFGQIARSAIKDAATEDKPTEEVMPCIFALETIMISFGVIKDVADRLADPKVDYSEFNSQIRDVACLRDLSEDFSNKHPRAKDLGKAFDQHAEKIIEFAESFKGEIEPRPYGGFVDFDYFHVSDKLNAGK